MKILWVAHEGGFTGANRCLLEYMCLLQEAGYEQVLVTPQDTQLAQQARLRQFSVFIVPFYGWGVPLILPIISIKKRFKKWVRNNIATYQLQQLFKSQRVSHVVTNTISMSVAAYAAAKSNLPHIWMVHEFGEEDHGFTLQGGFRKGATIMNQLSQKVVFNSKAVQAKFAPYIHQEKHYIVYNWADVSLEYNELGNQYISGPVSFLLLGQVAPAKNHAEAIKAMAICRKMGLDCYLNIVGKAESKDYLAALTTQIIALGLEKYVHFLGETTNTPAVMQQHHVLLMCSRKEAFGRVTVEALKCGLPVIAANNGGSVEIIEDGVNGLLYNVGNAEDLAEKMQQMLRSYSKFDCIEIAQKANEQYSKERTLQQLVTVFG